MTKLYNIEKIHFKSGYITNIAQNLDVRSSHIVPSVNAVKDAIDSITNTNEYVITIPPGQILQPGDILDVPNLQGVKVIYLGELRYYQGISLIQNQPTESIFESHMPIRIGLTSEYADNTYTAPDIVSINHVKFTPTELLIEQSLNINTITAPDVIILNTYNENSEPEQFNDVSTIEASGVDICDAIKCSNFNEEQPKPTITGDHYEEIKIRTKGFSGYFYTTSKSIKYEIDTEFIFEEHIKDTEYIPFIEITNSNSYIDKVIYPTVLPLNKHIFIDDEIINDVYVPFNSKVEQPLNTIKGVKIYKLGEMIKGKRKLPQDEYNLISREDYLMTLPYRHKFNIMFDMNYYRNDDEFDQTYKILFYKNELDNTFYYNCITETTPKIIYLSSKMYNDDMDTIRIKTMKSTVDCYEFKEVEVIKSLNLVYVADRINEETNKPDPDDIYYKPFKYIADDEYVCAIFEDNWMPKSLIQPSYKIKVCEVKTSQMFLGPENYGYIQILHDELTNVDTYTKVYSIRDVVKDDKTKFLCYDKNSEIYYLVAYKDTLTEIENYVVFKYDIDTDQGMFTNKVLDEQKEVITNGNCKVCFVSENITGLNIYSHDDCKIIYYNICNITKVQFDGLEIENNEVFIDIDMTNIKFEPNYTIGKIHFIDDSLDTFYLNDTYINFATLLNNDCYIYINKSKNYNKEYLARHFNIDEGRIIEEVLNPCFRLH